MRVRRAPHVDECAVAVVRCCSCAHAFDELRDADAWRGRVSPSATRLAQCGCKRGRAERTRNGTDSRRVVGALRRAPRALRRAVSRRARTCRVAHRRRQGYRAQARALLGALASRERGILQRLGARRFQPSSNCSCVVEVWALAVTLAAAKLDCCSYCGIPACTSSSVVVGVQGGRRDARGRTQSPPAARDSARRCCRGNKGTTARNERAYGAREHAVAPASAQTSEFDVDG